MEGAVLTLAFDLRRKAFPSEELEDFCTNKDVHGMKSHFFQHEGLAYWTILVRYDRIIPQADKVKDMTTAERKLFEQLRGWRKDTSLKAGIPPYLVATDAQFVCMIRKRIRSVAGLGDVKGFGKARQQKYGKAIVELIKRFFDHEFPHLEAAQ